MDYLNIVAPIFFAGFLLASFVAGFFSSWKKVLYFAVPNLVLLGCFMIVVYTNVRVLEPLSMKIAAAALPQKLADYNGAAVLIFRGYAIALVYLICFVLLNVLLWVVFMVFLRKKFKRIRFHRKSKGYRLRFFHRLLTAILQLGLFLPVSATLSSKSAASAQLGQIVAANISKLDSKEKTETAKQTALIFQNWNQTAGFHVKQSQNAWWNRVTADLNDQLLKGVTVSKFLNQVDALDKLNLFADNLRIAAVFNLYGQFEEVKTLFDTIFKETRSVFEIKGQDTEAVQNLNAEEFFKKLNELKTSEMKNVADSIVKRSITTAASDTSTNAEKTNGFNYASLDEAAKQKLMEENPKLPATVYNLNRLYEKLVNQNIFGYFQVIFNSYAAVDLAYFDKLLESFDWAGQVKNLHNIVSKFSGNDLKYIADQLRILATKKTSYMNKTENLNVDKKLKMSDAFSTYLTAFFAKTLKKVFTDQSVTTDHAQNLAQAILRVFGVSPNDAVLPSGLQKATIGS